jgi:hypothetical protein
VTLPLPVLGALIAPIGPAVCVGWWSFAQDIRKLDHATNLLGSAMVAASAYLLLATPLVGLAVCVGGAL